MKIFKIFGCNKLVRLMFFNTRKERGGRGWERLVFKIIFSSKVLLKRFSIIKRSQVHFNANVASMTLSVETGN